MESRLEASEPSDHSYGGSSSEKLDSDVHHVEFSHGHRIGLLYLIVQHHVSPKQA